LKKVILVFLLLVLSLSTLAAQEIFNHGDFSYKVIGQSITITKFTSDNAIAQIPASIDGLPVTIIGDGAFPGCARLTSVIIPPSVTAIGNWTFSDGNVTVSVTVACTSVIEIVAK
jgi:hypothetical protein